MFLVFSYIVNTTPEPPRAISAQSAIMISNGHLFKPVLLVYYGEFAEHELYFRFYESFARLRPEVKDNTFVVGKTGKSDDYIAFEQLLGAIVSHQSRRLIQLLVIHSAFEVQFPFALPADKFGVADSPVQRATELVDDNRIHDVIYSIKFLLMHREIRTGDPCCWFYSKKSVRQLKLAVECVEKDYKDTKKENTAALAALSTITTYIERANWYEGDRDADIARRCEQLLSQLPKPNQSTK